MGESKVIPIVLNALLSSFSEKFRKFNINMPIVCLNISRKVSSEPLCPSIKRHHSNFIVIIVGIAIIVVVVVIIYKNTYGRSYGENDLKAIK